ncbi:MAG: hypothetical protein AABW83_03070 [Nanoarchaeota archaeon]
MGKFKFRYFLIILILIITLLLIFNFIYSNFGDFNFEKNNYEYEICNDNGDCNYILVDKVIEPSKETFNVCNNNGLCEDVPVNRLLLKHGTDKEYCADAPYLSSSYIDNWWNSNGLIDECEMPPNSDMQFAFKQHNGSLSSYTGMIQITITPINYEENYLALQVLIGEDHNHDNLPDKWIFCGNVDSIKGKDKKIINCKGTELKFVKLVNPEWNPSSIYIDYILVLKAD